MTQICIFRLKFRCNICRYTCISIYFPWQYTLHFTKPSIPEKGGVAFIGNSFTKRYTQTILLVSDVT